MGWVGGGEDTQEPSGGAAARVPGAVLPPPLPPSFWRPDPTAPARLARHRRLQGPPPRCSEPIWNIQNTEVPLAPFSPPNYHSVITPLLITAYARFEPRSQKFGSGGTAQQQPRSRVPAVSRCNPPHAAHPRRGRYGGALCAAGPHAASAVLRRHVITLPEPAATAGRRRRWLRRVFYHKNKSDDCNRFLIKTHASLSPAQSAR